VPAYGYSPQGVDYNRQFKGTARWVPELNALRETDPQAYAEIERRANEIVFEPGYDVYSKEMEGGTGGRWERDPMSRALFQAFEEYKRLQAATQTDRPTPDQSVSLEGTRTINMPELTPYDDPQVEAAIQQIMRQSNVDRRTAIQMYKRLAQQPGGRPTDPRLGGMLSILGQAAKGGDVTPPGLMAPEVEGVDSPEVVDPPPPDQPDLAPGEERVTGESEQQGNDSPTSMAPLMSSGDSVYGSPVTEVGTGERVAGLLQSLATAGASYFGGRDLKASDQRRRQGTAQANLINALAGNIVAQAPRVSDSPGVATSIMKGLAKASHEYIRQEENQRKLDQTAMMTKLSSGRSPSKDTSMSGVFYEAGASVGRHWGDKDETLFSDDPNKYIKGKHKQTLAQLPPALRAPLVAEFQKGWREARNKMREEKRRGKANTDKQRLEALERFFETEGQLHASEGLPANTVGPTEEWVKARGGHLFSTEETLAAEASYRKGYNTQKVDQTNKITEKQVRDDMNLLAEKMAYGDEPISFFKAFEEHYGTADDFSALQNHLGGVLKSMKRYKLMYDVEYARIRRERDEEKGLERWQKEELVAVDNGLARVRQLEDRFLSAEVQGPIYASVMPIFQFFHPKSAAYDRMVESFRVELAAIINQGRPSDKDAEAVGAIIPKRTDTKIVAADLFESMRDMMKAKRMAILNDFDLPLNEFVTPAGEVGGMGKFDLGAYEARLRSQKLTQADAQHIIDQMNNPAFVTGKGGPQALAGLKKTLETAGIVTAQDEDGLVTYVSGGLEEAVELGAVDALMQ
tara:strand:- start:431 stop:2833 length:2403 start_codon:yes stop_codon:yes gene_type:complete